MQSIWIHANPWDSVTIGGLCMCDPFWIGHKVGPTRWSSVDPHHKIVRTSFYPFFLNGTFYPSIYVCVLISFIFRNISHKFQIGQKISFWRPNRNGVRNEIDNYAPPPQSHCQTDYI
eukprot:TRINITY_DN18886_c0_g1_i1.p1 TRINITY_DN18886_c0_g1~~TRINITY_DN18886_c0_g1_i1.p1  ORF type:complete len:117 (+),score=2.22 TRINITY_DN18886_c0_g1_i1:98-448(+)